MEDHDYINEHLKKTLDSYSLLPRASSFEEIQKKMQKKKRRGFIFFLFPGILVFFGALSFFFYSKPFNDKKSYSLSLVKQPTENASVKISTSEKVAVTELTPIPAGAPQTDLASLKERNLPSAASEKSLHKNEIKNVFVTSSLKVSKKPATKKDGVFIPESTLLNASLPVDASTQIFTSKNEVNALLKEDSKLNASLPVDASTKIFTSKNEANAILKEDSIGNNLQPDVLELTFLPLILNQQEKDLQVNSLKEITALKKDSVKKEKKVKVFLGASFNPQMGSYIYSQSKSATVAQQSFSRAYLQEKKDQNKFTFNYAFGLRVGILIKNKWELLAGIGFQKYSQINKPLSASVQTITGSPTLSSSNFNAGTAYDAASDRNATYKYYDLSTELARIYSLNRFFKVKTGLGIHAQRRLSLDYYGSKWIGNVNLKAGLIEDITKNIQFQVCPNVFYSPTSMLRKEYYFSQKNYGFGLECLLLFRLR